MSAALLGWWLAAAVLVHAGAHFALLFGLARRQPRWRALVAFVLPPLAPIWGWHDMPARSRAWIIALGAYAVVALCR